MKMARRFPEQEKLEAAGISAGKRERRGVRQMRLNANPRNEGARRPEGIPLADWHQRKGANLGYPAVNNYTTVENPTPPSADLPCVLRLTYSSDANHSYMEKPMRK